MRLYLLFAVFIVLVASCVPNRKIQLLQKNDVNLKDLPKDSVVRTYAVDTFNYKVQPNDVLSVRFESLTPEEFDFFSPSQPQQTAGLNISQGGLILGELIDENGEIPFPVI